ncbi:LysR family transcriptional regulator [Paraburkholderia haematera]|uniref:HTH-type transcriptional regulator PgrR n=1 Tax=Paraburkholderia haematera TaxID=2793077 RepID=A0ABN7KZ96_9BURK|nr:LysR family transcriptional regulator [Paraburkholderia haematera]CAE6722418.1 HTH-type transcriptional regulator PgrR [Paraburkholderia haematera]
MDLLQGMAVFKRVVDASSFSKAADSLEIPRASVSTLVQNLESHLGVRLLNRTTRSVQVTDDGALYYEYCARILAEVSDAESALSNKRLNPRGTIRVDTSATFAANVLLPAMRDFNARFPDITVKLGLADRNVDLVQEGVDCVIRIGVLDDSNLVARPIGGVRTTVCASPAYLDQMGEPTTPDDLDRHRAVNYFSARTGRLYPLELEVDGAWIRKPVNGILAVNEGLVYVMSAIEGLGIIQVPRFMVAKAIQAGTLREILCTYPRPCLPLSLLYPHRRLSTCVRIFSEWVHELAQNNPDLNGEELPEGGASRAAYAR